MARGAVFDSFAAFCCQHVFVQLHFVTAGLLNKSLNVIVIISIGGMFGPFGPLLDSHGITVYPHRAAICQLAQLTSEELLLGSAIVPCGRGVFESIF